MRRRDRLCIYGDKAGNSILNEYLIRDLYWMVAAPQSCASLQISWRVCEDNLIIVLKPVHYTLSCLVDSYLPRDAVQVP